nr:transcriptional repressor [Comamonas koreensis]
MTKEATILKRLREAKLRPTVARIGVIQIFKAAGSGAIGADDVYRSLARRGTRSSMGTVYRILSQCTNAGILLREWDGKRTALYRLKPLDDEEPTLSLSCRRCGHQMVVDDAVLLEYVVRIAKREGVSVGAGQINIELPCGQCSRVRATTNSDDEVCSESALDPA